MATKHFCTYLKNRNKERSLRTLAQAGAGIHRFQFAQLDPRPQGAEHNRYFLEKSHALGIEVTNSDLAAQCHFGNVDPQHTEGRTNEAAITRVFNGAYSSRLQGHAARYALGRVETPVSLVTVRPDLDSVGAMALITMQAEGFGKQHERYGEVKTRVEKIAQADTFARGDWPGPRPLPSKDNPWPAGAGGASDTRELAAIAAAVADFRETLKARVVWMRAWLKTGAEPAQYRERVERERAGMIEALERGNVTVDVATHTQGRVAEVKSTHQAGVMLGYMKAPVVVALNPRFKPQGGRGYKKFTVAQYKDGYVDMTNIRDALNHLEQKLARHAARQKGESDLFDPSAVGTWGGTTTILGSPQGASSRIKLGEVVRVVSRHLKPTLSEEQIRRLPIEEIYPRGRSHSRSVRELKEMGITSGDSAIANLNEMHQALGDRALYRNLKRGLDFLGMEVSERVQTRIRIKHGKK